MWGRTRLLLWKVWKCKYWENRKVCTSVLSSQERITVDLIIVSFKSLPACDIKAKQDG